MNIPDLTQGALKRVCLAQPDAEDWLLRCVRWLHEIDDLIDEPTSNEFRIRLFIGALALYTHPFFKAHEARLVQIIQNTTNAYADSVAAENSDDEDRKKFADIYRHFGVEIVLAVAVICAGRAANARKGLTGIDEEAGYAHMRAVSPELRLTNFIHNFAERKPQTP